MRNITICLFIKAREPGLLSIAGGRVKSLVPVFGGSRIIDYYMTPAVLFKNIKVFVFSERDAALKDYLLYTYNSGRTRIIDTDVFYALSKITSGRKKGGFLFMRADGALILDWTSLIQQLDALSDGRYVCITTGGHQFGVFTSESGIDWESMLSGGEEERGDFDRTWERISEHFSAGAKAIHLTARYMRLETVMEYYRTHLELLAKLKDNILLFAAPLGAANDENIARIGNGGFVRNSHISHSCIVEGIVDNSILFPGVRVGKGARIVRSIIMENNNIGAGAVVQNTVLCGNSELFSKMTPNIGEKAVVGDDERSGVNSEYPEFLRDGITLVGRNVEIPRKIRISSNCYIASNVDRGLLRGRDRIPPGSCIHAV